MQEYEKEFKQKIVRLNLEEGHMIIKALAENTSVSDNFSCEHGLSLYIETKKHKLLFDMGKSDLFVQNAKKLDVDLSEVDCAVISHGHYDHGGGLKSFLDINKKAQVYIHEKAFEKHFSKRPSGTAYIGLDNNLKNNERIVFTGGYYKIDDELELFSGIRQKELMSSSNKPLLMENGDKLVQDTFDHEQNLIITENGRTLLLAGCAHNGIVNIIQRFKEIKGKYADIVIGGFHLYSNGTGKSEDASLIKAIGERLKESGSLYYTCHCTGIPAFEQLSAVMGSKIRYLATGSVVEL